MAKRSNLRTRSLGDALRELIGSLGIDKKLREYDAVNDWEAIVGPAIARVATAEKISQGLLVVRVQASTWRNELNMRKQEIIAKLNQELGSDIVKDIKFQ